MGILWWCLPIECSQLRASRVDFFSWKEELRVARLKNKIGSAYSLMVHYCKNTVLQVFSGFDGNGTIQIFCKHFWWDFLTHLPTHYLCIVSKQKWPISELQCLRNVWMVPNGKFFLWPKSWMLYNRTAYI